MNALSKVLLAAGAGPTVLSGAGILALGVVREPAAPSAGAKLTLFGSF